MKNKTIAGLLALFLGGIGAHKFYLGQNWLGLLYLVFVWTFIPAILGLLEGLFYFSMSDKNFNKKYNGEDKNINGNKKVEIINKEVMEKRKKCSECLDDISKKANKCSHCGSSTTDSKILDKKLVSTTNKKPIYIFLFLIILGLSLLMGIIIWYVVILFVGIFYIWKKTKFNTRKKYSFIMGFILIMVALIFVTIYTERTPTITILEPGSVVPIQADSISIIGKVSPKNSVLTINGNSISLDNGLFAYEVSLKNENNNIQLVAENTMSSKQYFINLSITRLFTDEELKEKARKKAEEEARIAEIEAKRRAEENKLEVQWKASKAGKICTQNPTWTKEECKSVADGKIWIGMSYEMLKYKRGLPSSANPSNYGSGTEWQWCWINYIPSCFYDTNNDGKVDSYN